MRVKVLLQDTLVGQLAEIQGTTYFEFDGAFLRSNEELSPLHWPLAPGAQALAPFSGLRPGLQLAG